MLARQFHAPPAALCRECIVDGGHSVLAAGNVAPKGNRHPDRSWLDALFDGTNLAMGGTPPDPTKKERGSREVFSVADWRHHMWTRIMVEGTPAARVLATENEYADFRFAGWNQVGARKKFQAADDAARDAGLALPRDSA